MRVNFREGRVLMRRKNNGSKTALARVGDVFGVDEKAELAEGFFGENTQHPV